MLSFVHESLPGRVVFGAGRRAAVAAEADRLGATRVFLITDAGAEAWGDELARALDGSLAVRWTEVEQHVPLALAERARAAVTGSGADAVICMGGGSATGLAKAIALSHRLPILAVPTTYAGSEQTPIYGLTDDRHKQTGRDVAVLPRTVIYDPELTVGLPPHVTGPSAFNALAHSVEALWVPEANPVTTALALEGVRAIAGSLATAMAEPGDLDARAGLQYGAYLSGVALASTSTGLHHKLTHVLGGTFGLVHADTHSVVLPHAVAFNGVTAPALMGRLAAAMGDANADPAAALWDLANETGVPTSLAELGLTEHDLPEAARRAAAEITVNPRPVNEDDLLELLQRAYAGARPSIEGIRTSHKGEPS
jgi:maleylacetate reductase